MIKVDRFESEDVVKARLFTASGKFVMDVKVPCYGGSVSEVVRIPVQMPVEAQFRTESSVFDPFAPAPAFGAIDYTLIGKFTDGVFVYQS